MRLTVSDEEPDPKRPGAPWGLIAMLAASIGLAVLAIAVLG